MRLALQIGLVVTSLMLILLVLLHRGRSRVRAALERYFENSP